MQQSLSLSESVLTATKIMGHVDNK